MIKFKDLARCEEFNNFVRNLWVKPIIVNLSEVKDKKYNVCVRVQPLDEEEDNDKEK